VPIYNSRRWIDAFMQAVSMQRDVAVEVIAVDNDSSDDGRAHLAANWPDVKIVALDVNVGYAGGVNAGAAESHPGAHILAVNVDAQLHHGCLRRLLDDLDDLPEAGLVAPRLLEPWGAVQPSAHRFPTHARLLAEALFLDRLPELGLGYHLREDHLWTNATQVDWATGAVLLTRRAAWDAIGGFDPRYFFFVEELDLQRRLARCGWKAYVDPAATVVHHGGKRPIDARLFAEAHDGFDRYFSAGGRSASGSAARAILILSAFTRAAAWSALALARPRRAPEARSWAAMFARVIPVSLARLFRGPRAVG